MTTTVAESEEHEHCFARFPSQSKRRGLSDLRSYPAIGLLSVSAAIISLQQIVATVEPVGFSVVGQFASHRFWPSNKSAPQKSF